VSLKKLLYATKDRKFKKKKKKELILDRKAIEVKEINELCDKMK